MAKNILKTASVDVDDKKISELADAGVITGAEFVPIVQGGVTVKATTADLSGGSSTLQEAFDGGNTITMDGTHVSGIDITRAVGGPANVLSITDDNSRNGLDVDSTIGKIETNYDLQVIKDSINPLPLWGNFGTSTIFKFGVAKASLRVGTASATEFDDANIGGATYTFGVQNRASGISQFAAGTLNILEASSNDSTSFGLQNSISGSTKSVVLGDTNIISGGGSSKKYIIGSNITLSGASASNIYALGNNYSVTNTITNAFVYYDGSLGAAAFTPDINSFTVVVGGNATFNAPEIRTDTKELAFNKLISVLAGPGNHTPNINFTILVSGAVTQGTPLTPTATPGQVRAVSLADPINTPIVGVAAFDSVGNSVKITGAEIIPLRCATGQNFSATDLVERSSTVTGAVQIAAGPGPGVFAVAAMDFDGTISGGLFYGWKISNFCAS